LTDLRVDLQELFVKGLVFTEFADLSLGLAGGGRGGQRFRDGLALDLIGKAEVRAVAWVFGSMAMAVGLATSASGGSDRTTTQVAESGDLIGDLGAPLCEGFQRLGYHKGVL
jgi:hypothetical protein